MISKIDSIIRKNFIIQFFGQFGSRIIFYFFFIYAARMLGSKEFGIFSFVLSIGYIAYGLMEFGQDTLTVKLIARHETHLLPTLSLNRIFTSIVGLSGVLIISILIGETAMFPMISIGIGFFFFSIINYFCSFLRGIEKMEGEAVLLMLQRGLLFLLAVILFQFWVSAKSAGLSFCFSNFIAAVIGIYLIRKIEPDIFKWPACFSLNKAILVFKEAAPLAVASGAWMIYYRIDSIMLAELKDMNSVGIYNGAYRIAEGLILISRVIMMVTFPVLTRHGAEKGAEFYNILKKLFLSILGVSIFFSGLMFFLASLVIRLSIGSQYSDSTDVLKILLLSVVALSLGYLVTHALIAIDLQKVYMYAVIGGTVLNISLNWVLIPEYGSIGAAWATVCTDTLVTIFCCGFMLFEFRKWKNKCASA